MTHDDRHDNRPDGSAIEVVALEKRYGDLVALAPTSLTIDGGEFVALIGHNGSGKSTLLKLLAGVLESTDGEVRIAGEPSGSDAARAVLSFIGDDPILYDDLSVREHLEYLLPLHDAPGWEARAEEVLERFGLTDRADDLPARFSRGLRQKTALTLGFTRPHDVLLIDEPFVGLDQSGRAGLLALLDEAKAAGSTVVVATHDLDAVARADRCIALRDGALVHDGPADAADVADLAG